MSLSLVQSKNNSSNINAGITSNTLAYASSPTAHNLLVAVIGAGLTAGSGPTDPTVSDTLGNTWTKIVAVHEVSGQTNPSDGYIYAALNNKSTGANTITVSFGAQSMSFISITGYEFQDSAGSPNGFSSDAIGSATGGNTAANMGATTGATARANEIVVAGNANWTAVPTADAGYTNGPTNSSAIFTGTEHKFVSATGTQTAYNTTANGANFTTVVATFFTSAAAGAAFAQHNARLDMFKTPFRALGPNAALIQMRAFPSSAPVAESIGPSILRVQRQPWRW